MDDKYKIWVILVFFRIFFKIIFGIKIYFKKNCKDVFFYEFGLFFKDVNSFLIVWRVFLIYEVDSLYIR